MKKDQLSIYKILGRLLNGRFLLIGSLLLMSLAAKSQQATLVAVGNQTGVPSGMKFSELKAVLMGERQRWKNGNRIIIALMKTNTPVGKSTSARIYDMTGDELNKFWLAQVFQGKAQAPNFFNSANELETFVAQNPGAIGILDKPLADAEIKSIMIDGQKMF
jgi:F0F1-type ATP synthase beta subunit